MTNINEGTKKIIENNALGFVMGKNKIIRESARICANLFGRVVV